jgi:5-methylcytosine-specific restriction endonuclease McrA
MCKDCVAVYQRSHYLENTEDYKQRAAEQRQQNPEEVAEYQKEYREAHRDKISEQKREYRRINKDRIKQLAAAYYRANRDICIKKARLWAINNPERFRISVQRWKKNNSVSITESARRRRAKKLAATIVPFTIEQLEQRLSLWAGDCSYCGIRPAEHVDHVKPLHLDGPHCLANLRPACAQCNLRKGAMPHRQWFALLESEQCLAQ